MGRFRVESEKNGPDEMFVHLISGYLRKKKQKDFNYCISWNEPSSKNAMILVIFR